MVTQLLNGNTQYVHSLTNFKS